MNTNKVNPFFKGQSMGHFLDNVFNNNLSGLIGSDHSVSNPSVNISEDDEKFLLELAAPGLEKSDFKISVEKDQLTVSSNKSAEKEEGEKGKWNRREFSYHSFTRTFHISDEINLEKIDAEYKNGILGISLPKNASSKVNPIKTVEIK
jgi:HSP20 family protein